MVVSIDGLAPEHDQRRAPATYDRILKHIAGHRITVHCTVTRPMLATPGYLDEFSRFWSLRPEVHKIWFSIYTPQQGNRSPERLHPQDRETLFQALSAAAAGFPRCIYPAWCWRATAIRRARPRSVPSPGLTTCLSADLKTRVTPCQFGGSPVCAECGCVASAGMHTLAGFKLGGIIPLSTMLNSSIRLGGVPAPRHRAVNRFGGRRRRFFCENRVRHVENAPGAPTHS